MTPNIPPQNSDDDPGLPAEASREVNASENGDSESVRPTIERSRSSAERPYNVMFEHSELHIGPLPSAQELGRYEKILPGAADRIMAMAESEVRHGEKQENRIVLASVIRAYAGQAMAFVITIGFLGCGTYLAISGHDAAGVAFVVTGLVPVLTAFLGGIKKKMEKQPSGTGSEMAATEQE